MIHLRDGLGIFDHGPYSFLTVIIGGMELSLECLILSGSGMSEREFLYRAFASSEISP